MVSLHGAAFALMYVTLTAKQTPCFSAPSITNPYQKFSSVECLLFVPAERPRSLNIRVVGSVLQHETTVVQALQQHLQHQNIAMHCMESSEQQHHSVTLIFHRKKARLPQDEIQAIMSSAQGVMIAHVDCAMLQTEGMSTFSHIYTV